MEGPGVGDLRGLYERGWAGELDQHPSALKALEGDASDLAMAWGLLLSAQAWFSGSAQPFPWTVEEARALAGRISPASDAAQTLAIACAIGAREAVLSFDPPRVAALASLQQALVGPQGSGEASLWSTVSSVWAQRLLEVDVATGALDLVESAARALGRPALVIEAVALRALLRADAGDVEEATALARRASRMARTEAMPQPEYLANVVLSRVRRLSGKPHLATRILVALLRVAPPPWRRWMDWELALAGGLEVPADPGAMMRGLVDAAAKGDRARFDELASGASLEAAGSLLSGDVEALLSLLDPARDLHSPELAAWARGETDGTPPGGLYAVALAHPVREMAEDPVWVVAPAGATGRRVLSPGVGLTEGLVSLPPGKRRRGRTDAATSALVLQAEPSDEVALFERLYGFRYQVSLHQGARDTLYYRVRDRVGEYASLEREGGRVSLTKAVGLAVPDPRCSPPPEHALLAMLAQRGHASVKEAAAALGIPLRTAQHALRALAEDGALQADKRGRELHYVLEDTTFCEPTRSTQVK